MKASRFSEEQIIGMIKEQAVMRPILVIGVTAAVVQKQTLTSNKASTLRWRAAGSGDLLRVQLRPTKEHSCVSLLYCWAPFRSSDMHCCTSDKNGTSSI